MKNDMSEDKRTFIDGMMEDNSIKEKLKEEEEKSPDLPDRLKDPLRKKQHSLGRHPAIPEDDDQGFEERTLVEKYRTAINDYKRHHDVDEFTESNVIKNLNMNVLSIMEMEGPHRKELERLAVEMVRNEYDVPEEDVEMNVELVDEVEPFDVDGENENPGEIEFDDEDEKEKVNKEIQKRRMVNSMIQGAAFKGNHMFHLAENEISEMNPRLPSNYGKMVSECDYQYLSGMGLVFDKSARQKNKLLNDGIKFVGKGGDVKVDFPEKEGDTPRVNAKGTTLPILIHELVKGVMEVLSSHGLPDEPDLRKYIIEKADRADYEPWDLVLGPCIWERFLSIMEPDDIMELKQYVYSELISLPPDEFHDTMREILDGTKKGKEYINGVARDIRNEIEHEQMEEEMNRYGDELGGTDDPNEMDDLM